MDDAIRYHLNELEKLLRRADEAVSSARTTLTKRRATKQRNAINAACNAMHRAYTA